MMSSLRSCAVPVLFGLLGINCGLQSDDYGGVTADISYEGQNESIIRQGLRTSSPPPEIDRLLISVVDVNGSTLASTQLTIDGAENAMLNREGGTWQIDAVPVGIDHSLVAQAFFGQRGANASQYGQLAFQGIKKNIKVESGKTTNAGTLFMKTVPSARIPRLDRSPPQPFETMLVSPTIEGNGIEVFLEPPADADFAGAIIAVSTSTETQAPLLTRGSSIAQGRALLPNVPELVLHGIYTAPWTNTIRIDGLNDLETYKVVAYGFDTDFEGRPLNFSVPTSRQSTPFDSDPPGPVSNVTVTASITAWFKVTFTSPGEDGLTGTVASYEIRAGFDAAALEDPEQFSSFSSINPPEPVEPGQTSTVVARFDDVGVSPTDDFNVGIRAIDDAGNLGPIVVTPYTLSATISPNITQMSPPAALINGLVTITGERFGREPGRILLTQDVDPTTSAELMPMSWTNEQIVFSVPEDANSGVLSITRKDGRGASGRYLAILVHVETQLDNTYPLYEIFGLSQNSGTQISALFSSQPNGTTYNNAVEHLIDGQRQGTRYETLVEQSPPAVVAGAMNETSNQFAFLSSVQGGDAINAWLISSSTAAPNNRRNQRVATQANTESLSLQLLDSSNNTVPAVLAVAANGDIQIANTSDLLSTNFSGFTTVTSTFSDRVNLGRREQGNVFQYLLAYREGGSTNGKLLIQTANGQGTGPTQFSRPNYATRPDLGENIRILDVPGIGFVIAYEERQLGGRSDIRLLKLDDYNNVGYAPFPSTNSNRVLHDVGLVTQGGVPFIAVSFTTLAGGSRLYYSEINPVELVSDGRGNHSALDLGFVPENVGQPAPQARLSCKKSPQRNCSLVWLDVANVGSVYLRR